MPETAVTCKGYRVRWVAYVALFGLGASTVLDFPLNHDIAWMLYVAGRFMDGARLYVDVVEVNPPLILLLLTPVVAVARALGAWEVSAFRIGVIGLAALSLWLSRRRLADARADTPAAQLILLVLTAAFLFLPAAESGQREHLMLLLTTPYLLSVSVRLGGTPVARTDAIAVGVLGGLGFLLKPHFLAVLVAVELLLARRRGRLLCWRPELAAVFALGVLYAVALTTFASGYLTVARWATSVYGSFYPSSPAQIALSRGTLFAVVTLAAAFAMRGRGGAAGVRAVFAAATAGFTLAVFVQNKNWDYHWLPVYGAGAVVWAGLAVDWLGWWPAPTAVTGAGSPGPAARTAEARPPVVLSLLTLLLIGTGMLHARRAALYTRSLNEQIYGMSTLIAAVERERTERGIFVFASTLQPAFPLVTYTDVLWTSRFNSLWPLPGLYEATSRSTRAFPYHTRPQMSDTERYLFDSVVEDLVRARPSLLIVDRAAPGRALYGFDYLAYFSADEQFRALLREYELAHDVGRYVILRRVSVPSPVQPPAR